MNITDKITITNEDNMELMARYPDKYFELAIVDPPYGLKGFSVNENRDPNSKYRRSMSRIVNSAKEWNSIKPTSEYWKELFRVSREQIVWGANNFELPPSEYFIIWDKKQTVPNFAGAEYAWVSMNKWKKPAKVFTYQIHRLKSDEGEKIHPAQKPVALYKWLLQNYTKPGDKILDTHLGSGSIAIACHDSGFELTACELDKEYYDKAIERVKKHIDSNIFYKLEKTIEKKKGNLF